MKINIKELFQECGYTKSKEIENDLGVSRMTIHNWKTKNVIPPTSIKTLIYLMKKSKQRKYKKYIKFLESLGW